MEIDLAQRKKAVTGGEGLHGLYHREKRGNQKSPL
jgi:hypothetical protein